MYAATLKTNLGEGFTDPSVPLKTDYLSDDWIEMSWLTLTEPNETHHSHLVKDTNDFIQRLAEFTECHIGLIWGLQGAPNTHMHGAICVPRHETEHYRQQIKKYKIKKQWLFRDTHFESWKPNLGTYIYILEKHFPQEAIQACPRYYARCKKGGSGCTDIVT